MNVRGKPTRRQAQVLDVVRETFAKDGIAPSYEMIRHALGIGTRGEICRIVTALERDGKIARVGRGKVRRLRLNIANYPHA